VRRSFPFTAAGQFRTFTGFPVVMPSWQTGNPPSIPPKRTDNQSRGH